MKSVELSCDGCAAMVKLGPRGQQPIPRYRLRPGRQSRIVNPENVVFDCAHDDDRMRYILCPVIQESRAHEDDDGLAGSQSVKQLCDRPLAISDAQVERRQTLQGRAGCAVFLCAEVLTDLGFG